MTISEKHTARKRFIRLADQDIDRYREVRDIYGKVFETFLDGAAYMYRKAGLSKKARAIRRLLRYVRKHGLQTTGRCA